ncbi:MAG: hypothetical protein P4L92_00985 [Rudaea sp.]|nr:hypothetical protein [Rudaea sp.]
MDEDNDQRAKRRLSERLLVVETELRSLKSALGVVGTVAALVFGLLGIALSWNVVSERQEFSESRKDIRDDVHSALNQIAEEPDITLAKGDGSPLSGATVEPTIELSREESGKKIVQFPIVITNEGNGWTGRDVAIKIYTPNEIPGPDISTDEPAFKFQNYWIGAEDTGLQSMPGKFSYTYDMQISVEASKKVPAGKYLCLVKFYYGRGKIAIAKFVLLIKTDS